MRPGKMGMIPLLPEIFTSDLWCRMVTGNITGLRLEPLEFCAKSVRVNLRLCVFPNNKVVRRVEYLFTN